jgi:hypothetical protein
LGRSSRCFCVSNVAAIHLNGDDAFLGEVLVFGNNKDA